MKDRGQTKRGPWSSRSGFGAGLTTLPWKTFPGYGNREGINIHKQVGQASRVTSGNLSELQ